MEAEILKFLEYKKETKEALKNYVVNKKIPLEFRWNLFIKSDLGDVEGYYEDFDNLDDAIYSELEYNRYQYIDLPHVIELLSKGSNSNYIRKKDEKQSNEEAIIELKEEVLKKFLKAFIFDW